MKALYLFTSLTERLRRILTSIGEAFSDSWKSGPKEEENPAEDWSPFDFFSQRNDMGFEATVAIERQSVRSEFRISIKDRQHLIPSSFSVFKEGSVDSAPGESIRTGDPVFDEYLDVRGEPAEFLALMNDQSRHKLLAAFRRPGWKLTIQSGSIQCDEVTIASETMALRQAKRLVRLARSLRLKAEDVPSKLATNALTDPDFQVRIENLKTLRSTFPLHAATLGAARHYLHSTRPEFRLEAARCLGDDGSETLQSLLADNDIDPSIRSDALRFLVTTLPPEVRDELLEQSLSSKSHELARAAIEEIGRLKLTVFLPRLAAIGNATDDDTRQVLAAALGQIDDPASESALLRWLESASEPVQLAAIRALSLIGTAVSVEPLLNNTSGKVGRAARQAVDAIQSRLGDADGRLSLSESRNDEGALSLAGAEGSLSLPETGKKPLIGENPAAGERRTRQRDQGR